MIQLKTYLFIVIQQQMMNSVQYQLMIWTMQGNQKEQIMIGMWFFDLFNHIKYTHIVLFLDSIVVKLS